MEISIKSKDYSFPEAFNAVGKKLVPGWKGDEIDVQECHSPKDVDSVDTLPKRLLQFTVDMANAPDVDPADLERHINGVEHARLNRQSAPWAQEIKDLGKDPEAYQERYALWSRLREAERPFNDIMHHGHADGWIETPEGDRLDIQPTHWGRRGPFTPPQLPGTCGEYRGVVGEVWIGKERLDTYLRTLAAGRKTRGEQGDATRQKIEMWTREIIKCEQERPDWQKSRILKKVAKDLNIEKESEKESLRRRMYDPGGHWAK